MVAAPTPIPVAGPVDSLEVRWMLSGPLVTAVRNWFARFPAGMEAREDTYLLRPRLPGLSVKLRDRDTLDVKSRLGSSGILEVPYRCQGRLESWRKWSFRYDPPGESDVLPAGWSVVRKRRCRVWFPLPGEADPPGTSGCAVELTQAYVHGDPWWSVGFEALGAVALRPAALEHAATLVFAEPLPAGVEFRLDNSLSYAQWLRDQPADDAGDAQPRWDLPEPCESLARGDRGGQG